MKRFYAGAIPLLILSTLLVPPLSVFIPVPLGLRVSDLVVMFFLVRVSFGGRDARAVAWGTPQRFLVWFSLSVCLSLLIGSLKGQPANLRDLVPVARYWMDFAFLTLVLSAIHSDDSTTDRIYRWLAIGSGALSVVVLQQAGNWFGLNALYLPRISPSQTNALGLLSDRPVGLSAMNPNVLGFMTVLLALSMLHATVRTRRPLFLVLFLAQLYCLFLTGSRSSVVALAMGGAVYALANIWRATRGRPAHPVLAVCLVFGALALFVSVSSDPTSPQATRMQELRDVSESRSAMDHLAKAAPAVQETIQNPLFGVGSTAEIRPQPDSDWTMLFLSYGVVGTFLLVGAFVSIVVSGNTSKSRTLGFAALSAAVPYMATAAITSSVELTELFIFVLAVSVVPQVVRTPPSDSALARPGRR